MTLSKTSAFGAMLQAVHFVAIIVLTVLMGAAGIAATNGGLYNPQSGLEFALRSPLLMYFHMAHLLVVFGMIPVVWVFHLKLSPADGRLIAVASGTGSAAILLAFLSVLPGLLFPFLAQAYTAYAVETQGAYLAIILLSGAFLRGSGFLIGGWMLLVSIVALRASVFPKALNLLGVLVGAAGVLSLFITQMDIAGLVGLIWWVWLSILLLRERI